MKPILCLSAIALSLTLAPPVGRSQTAPVLPPDERRTLGTRVPEVWFIDEHGDTLALRALSGAPIIVSPVFTTCPHVCPAITGGLISALEGVGGLGRTFRVLTVSFDPADTPEALRAYREKTRMPPEWLLAGGAAEQVRPFLDALDFRTVALPEGGFMHPNVIAFLSPELEIRHYLHGVFFDAEEVKAGLRIAAGQKPLVERFKPVILSVGILAAVVLALIVAIVARKTHA